MHTAHPISIKRTLKSRRGLGLMVIAALTVLSVYLTSNSLAWAASPREAGPSDYGHQAIQAYKTASQWMIGSNQLLTYTIHVRNVGTADTSAQVIDPLPAQLNFVSGSANHAGLYDAGTNTVAWHNVTITAASEVTFSFAVTVSAVTTPTAILNTATISTGATSLMRSVWVMALPESLAVADLSPSAKYAARFMVEAGDTVPYVIKLINRGTVSALTDITDPLPLEMTYVPGSANGGGMYDPGTRTLAWHHVTVPAFGQIALSYVTTATTGIISPTWVMNTATIAAGTQSFDRQATVVIVPSHEVPPHPLLAGSYKKASQYRMTPNDTLTYTIKLVNSGAVDALADVVDPVPPALSYVDNSATHGGTYEAGTQIVSWEAITVPADSSVPLSFAVMATGAVTHPMLLLNTATISVTGDNAFRRQVPVLLMPTSSGDDIRPIVHSLTIGDQDVLTSPTTTLHISATDNISVSQMYIREWQLTSTPFPHWTISQSSGWIPYQADYPWTLMDRDGVHFVGVWVADAAHNVSDFNHGSLDFASLVRPAATVAQKQGVPYLVYYPAGVTVTVQLSTTQGDADLYVWYPHNFFWPDRKSLNPSPITDTATFTTPRAGIYLFMVRGYTDATYDLSINPAGGPRAWPAATGNDDIDDEDSGGHYYHDSAPLNLTAPSSVSSKTDAVTFEPLLSQSGADPLVMAPAPAGFNVVYLPLIMR